MHRKALFAASFFSILFFYDVSVQQTLAIMLLLSKETGFSVDSQSIEALSFRALPGSVIASEPLVTEDLRTS